MAYTPGFMPPDAPAWLVAELQSIAQQWSSMQDFVLLKTLHAAPSKIRDGMVVKADGTNWNPGSGSGVYVYRDAAWHFLG